MHGFVTNDVEVGRKPGFGEHIGSIAADRIGLAGFEEMMVIQGKGMGRVRQRPLVNGHLTVVFTQIFQFPV